MPDGTPLACPLRVVPVPFLPRMGAGSARSPPRTRRNTTDANARRRQTSYRSEPGPGGG